ncbi:mycofactocin-coupled SDR family oxidoreductase [Streptomyces sp. NPDC026672]|uniref:mycofactocin-coupled SDR family oxidoreductase n=1 Tax=unclassified Streptomyces TaxID=2593676 RepID=UPI0033F3AEF7
MAGRFAGKVAFITGAARGVGRAHAVRLADEGADIIALDICGHVVDTGYPVATREDLEETARLVRAHGRRVVTAIADVRDYAAVDEALKDAVDELGRLDVVVANAGVGNWGNFWELTDRQWRDVIDVNLTGVFNTLKAAAPILIGQGEGGSIIVISSVAGLKAVPGQAHYVASKHAVTGLVKNAAIELAPHRVRVNSIHPWGIDTDMGRDTWAMPLIEANPSYMASFSQTITEPRASDPEDIAAAGAWLASDEARTVTGTQLTVDHGATKV